MYEHGIVMLTQIAPYSPSYVSDTLRITFINYNICMYVLCTELGVKLVTLY